MEADVRVSHGTLDLHLHARRCGESELRGNRVHLWRRSAHEHERDDVFCRTATLQVSCSHRGSRRRLVVVDGQSVVVLGVVVLVVGVRVQQRGLARRGDQRRYDQQRQGAVHTISV